jgi:hypothetical protein
MSDERTQRLKEAFEKSGGKLDRWVLRLGKNEDEAGKFEAWHQGPEDFEQDFQGFLECLALTRTVTSVTNRMKEQKKLIRQYRKEAREAAKALAKEQEKLRKAMEKAEKKKQHEEEKVRLKAEAKVKREADKAEKKSKAKANTTKEINELGPEILPEQDRAAPQPTQRHNGSKETPANSGSNCSVEPNVQEVRPIIEEIPIAVAKKKFQGFLSEEPAVQIQTITLPGEK